MGSLPSIATRCWSQRVIVTQRSDMTQIKPVLQALNALPIGKPWALLADAGYCSELNVERCVASGIEPYIAISRDQHHWGLRHWKRPKPRGTMPALLPKCAIGCKRPKAERSMRNASPRLNRSSETSNEVWAFDNFCFAESQK